MKICVIICEFNPFHNGHAHLLRQARAISGCDKVVCVMSGAFTQRGEPAILDKYTRARHAVLGGADLVLELPAHFAVAPAEIFARGAVKIAAAIPGACALAFGCESGSRRQFLAAAELLSDESETFKKVLNEKLDGGESYIKSYCAAFEACGGDGKLLASPNSVLGVEYAKAIKRAGADLEIYPVERVGAEYSDGELKENFSSASAIRGNLSSPLVENNVPAFVYEDLKGAKFCSGKFKALSLYALLAAATDDIKRVYGCGEGLENRLKDCARLSFEEIIGKCTSKRYSSARIRRILCANMLRLYADDAQKMLESDLYFKPLAVNSGCADEIFSALAGGAFPLLVRERDACGLSEAQRVCLDGNIFADGVAAAVSGKNLHYYTFEKVTGNL